MPLLWANDSVFFGCQFVLIAMIKYPKVGKIIEKFQFSFF